MSSFVTAKGVGRQQSSESGSTMIGQEEDRHVFQVHPYGL